MSMKTSAETGSKIREALGKAEAVFAKPDIQPIASHSIDAMCAYATACADNRFCTWAAALPNFADAGKVAEGDVNLLKLHPREVRIIRVEPRDPARKTRHDSRPIFKEGIYSECFLPILYCREKVYVGFSLPDKDGNGGNALEVKGTSPVALFELLAPLLDKPFNREKLVAAYHIVPEKAFEHLSGVALGKVEPSDMTKLVLALRYFTQKVSVIGKFLTPDRKRLVSRNEAIKDKDFLIHTSCNLKKTFKFNGALTLPVREDWNRLADQEELKSRWGQPVDDQFDLDSWAAIQLKLNSSKRERAPVRRVSGLPIVSSPSGGFRIRRSTPDNGVVYQVYAINDAKYVGFTADERGIIDWKSPKLFWHLQHENLTSTDVEITEKTRLVAMSEWRTVHQDGEFTVSISPATAGRPYVRISMPFEILKCWLSDAGIEGTADYLLLPHEIKLPSQAGFVQNAPQELLPLLGKPRDKIVFTHLGRRVTLVYQTSNATASMTQAFNKVVQSEQS